VRQPPHHGVPSDALAPAATTPPVRLHDPAGQDSTVRLKPLPDDLQPELLETAERGQVRASEGSVRHVEVFQMGGMRTSIIGRPRRLPRDRRARDHYTVNCEEPEYRAILRNLLHQGGHVDYTPRQITVTLDRPDSPRVARALQLLTEELNTTPARLPGDRRPLTYQLAGT